MIKEHDCVVLTNDLPSAGLLSGMWERWSTFMAMSPRTRLSSPPSPERRSPSPHYCQRSAGLLATATSIIFA